jgi:poly(A) polymerase
VRLMHNCHQGTYHHLDVWPHSLETVHQLDGVLAEIKEGQVREYVNEILAGERTRAAAMKLAALLHDIGKPETRRLEEGGRISFHGHEHVGQRIVRLIARMLKLSTRERLVIEDIVRWHLRPGYLSNFKKPGERAIYRFFRDTKDEAASTLLVSLADQRSTRGPATTEYDQEHHEKICLSLVRQYFKKKNEKPLEKLISGDDLIRKLRLEPSPLFTRILTAVKEKQTLGEITTKEEALALAKTIAKEK